MKKGKVHQIIWKEGTPYYRCNQAIDISGQQILFKTNSCGKQVTCKNCKKWGEDAMEKSMEKTMIKIQSVVIDWENPFGKDKGSSIIALRKIKKILREVSGVLR